MKGLDDCEDGLDDAAFERALGLRPKRKKKGQCKRGHAGPLGTNCGDCLMEHCEVVPFEAATSIGGAS